MFEPNKTAQFKAQLVDVVRTAVVLGGEVNSGGEIQMWTGYLMKVIAILWETVVGTPPTDRQMEEIWTMAGK